MNRPDQIRRAHRSAKPTPQNPAWYNAHRDITYLLAKVNRQEKEVERLRFENQLLKEGRRRDGQLRDSENV